jgi:putative oxidoreductase
MTSTPSSQPQPSEAPVAMQRGRHSDRITLAKLRLERWWVVREATTSPGLALLVLRVVVGVTFLAHGLQKLGDVAGTERFFTSLGIPAPQLMAPFVGLTEVGGGLLLIAGLATALAAAALAADMLVAGLTARLGHGFFASDGGFELELLLGSACLAVLLAGAGRFSVDAVLR